MESQGEREPGVLEMDVGLLESMVQDETPEQDINVQEQFLPQPDPEPEMAAAAAYDTTPPPLRQNPPFLVEPSALDMILQAIRGMNEKMDGNTNKMEANMQTLQGEMRQMGQCLQAGIMAPPRAGPNELRGSATAVRPTVGRVRTV